VGKANGSRECAADGVPTIGTAWWARREERAFAHPTIPPSLRANGSRERAPDDRLREAIQRRQELDCFVARAPRNDD
jgi:hypothetical protein